MKIAVVLPSRGLMFSETAEELLNNLDGYNYEIFFAHKLPIPDCFEKPLKKVLRGKFSHIWFVEDDMQLPEGTLTKMLEAEAPVVTLDYPVSPKGQGTVLEVDGRVIFTGTGCLLVKREVFNILRPPYFRIDVKWGAINHGDFVRLTANSNANLTGYGLHDVNFGLKLYRAGILIRIAGKTGHRKLVAWGDSGTNDGAHKIEVWTKIKKDYLLKQWQIAPSVEVGQLIVVRTPTGDVTVHPDHAKRMIKLGLAKKIPKKKLEIDWNSVKL